MKTDTQYLEPVKWEIVRNEPLMDDTGRYQNTIRDTSIASVSNQKICTVYSLTKDECTKRTKLISQSKELAKALQDNVAQSQRVMAIFNSLWFDKYGQYPDDCADINDMVRKNDNAKQVLKDAGL